LARKTKRDKKPTRRKKSAEHAPDAFDAETRSRLDAIMTRHDRLLKRLAKY
jgi:hypothetical protein